MMDLVEVVVSVNGIPKILRVYATEPSKHDDPMAVGPNGTVHVAKEGEIIVAHRHCLVVTVARGDLVPCGCLFHHTDHVLITKDGEDIPNVREFDTVKGVVVVTRRTPDGGPAVDDANVIIYDRVEGAVMECTRHNRRWP